MNKNGSCQSFYLRQHPQRHAPHTDVLFCYCAPMPADNLITQPFIHGEHLQVIDDDIRVSGLRVSVLFHAVVGECDYP